MDDLRVTPHHVLIRNREFIELTGIKKIISLDDETFTLETFFGKMTIQGKMLEMKNFDIEKEELLITGQVNLIEYLDKNKKKGETMVSKLFK